jgi:hypothetical protein
MIMSADWNPQKSLYFQNPKPLQNFFTKKFTKIPAHSWALECGRSSRSKACASRGSGNQSCSSAFCEVLLDPGPGPSHMWALSSEAQGGPCTEASFAYKVLPSMCWRKVTLHAQCLPYSCRARISKVKFVHVIRCWATTVKNTWGPFSSINREGCGCSVYPMLSFNCSLFVLR